jgi:hypothetical protein
MCVCDRSKKPQPFSAFKRHGLLSAVQRFVPESRALWITMRSTTLFVTFLAMCVAVSLAGRSKGGDGLSKLLKEGRAARSNQDMQACLGV